jgi:hypothetical protein
MNDKKKIDEARIAEEIVSVLPAGIARSLSPDRDSIRYSVRGEGMKLRTIVLQRSSLQKLAVDADRAVKVEYLQRDLLSSAGKRTEFRYPAHPYHHQSPSLRVSESPSPRPSIAACQGGRI